MSDRPSDRKDPGPAQQGVTRRRLLRSLAGVGVGAGAVVLGIRFWPEDGEAPPEAAAGGGNTSTTQTPSTTSPAATPTTEAEIPEHTLADFVDSIQPVLSKDDIPPIDEPVYMLAGEVDFLEDADIVFGLSQEGVTRAYPQLILVWHEIVNNQFPDVPSPLLTVRSPAP